MILNLRESDILGQVTEVKVALYIESMSSFKAQTMVRIFFVTFSDF